MDRAVQGGRASPWLVEAARWGGLPFSHVLESAPVLYRLALQPLVQKLEARWAGTQVIISCCTFRRIMPDQSNYIFWHTDADGTDSHQFDPMWNCWIPLEEVGMGRFPSLQVLVESERVMRGVEAAHPGHRAKEWVQEVLPGAQPMCPVLRRGDALVFGHYYLHRTEPMRVLAGERIGAEVRFTRSEQGLHSHG